MNHFAFEVILYDNGNILMQYAPGNPAQGSGSTTGIENADASDGLTHACNTANSIVANRAILFTHPDAGGLTMFPPSGTLVSHTQFDLTLIVEAPGLAVTGGEATVNGGDMTAALLSCLKPGTLVTGGQSFRCPGLTGAVFGAGTHTVSIALDLSNGSRVSRHATWKVIDNTEP